MKVIYACVSAMVLTAGMAAAQGFNRHDQSRTGSPADFRAGWYGDNDAE